MNNGHRSRFRVLRLATGAIVVVFGILSALGSGGGGDTGGAPSGEAPAPVTKHYFDVNNSISAARAAVAVTAFFPGFTTFEQRIMTTLAASDPGNSPFDLAMCANAGRSMLTWIDGDHSGDITAGDSTSLQFTDCDLDGNGAVTTGTVKFGFTGVNPDPLPNSVSLNAAVNLKVANGADTTAVTGNFGTMASTQDGIEFTNIYTAYGSTNQELALAENNTALTQFGCFKVTQVFSSADGPGIYKLSSSGVINASDTIMGLANDEQLSFVNDWLESGTQHLLSSAPSGCTVLGVTDGIEGSDGSYLNIEALGGGNLRLRTFDASNLELNTTDTTWEALLKPIATP